MAENYDLIFGQGASSQYAWSDSDYQNGWKTVGSTPPTAEQFDALQRRSDTKAKDLNNRLSPLETTASKALARVTPAANRLPYFNSSNSATTTAISDFSKTLLDDKDAATARATLGAPSMTGANASGSWNINAATATKLATPRKINITGNATGAATFDGTGDANINVSVSQAAHADKATADANGNELANAQLYMHVYDLPNNTDFNDVKTTGIYTCTKDSYTNRPAASWGVLRVYWFTRDNVKQEYIPDNMPEVYERYSIGGKWNAWSKLNAANADTAAACSGNSATATKLATPRAISLTGNASGSANFDGSGNVSISTTVNESNHAASATDADKLDGYHASDLLRTLGGNRTPVITDIFDRAGTIDMSTMSAADKATNKANINKASNMTQNLWNKSSGIRAYGGDTDMNGYSQGTLKLTQSYKNFDKILVVNSNDDANWIAYTMWDVWELAHAFANSYRFNLLGQGDIYWNLYGTAKHGTTTNYAVSTDTVWSCQAENSGIIAIYGIKF